MAMAVRKRSKPCSEATTCAGHLGEDSRVLVMLVPDEKFKKIKNRWKNPLILRGHLSGKAVVQGCSCFHAGILRAV